MTYRLLQLRKLRNSLLHPTPAKRHPSSRRNFLRNMGAGIVVCHPVSKAVSALAEQPFEIKQQSGHVVVYRKGRAAWEIGGTFFNRVGEVSLHALPDGYRILAEHLEVAYTDLLFSLKAEIKKGQQGWTMEITFPELGIHDRVDFIDWLDGRAGVSGESVQPEHRVRMHAADGFLWQGGCAVYVDAGWRIALKGDARIRFRHQGTDYLTNGIILEPATEIPDHISVVPARSLQITLPSFVAWEAFMSSLEFYNENSVIPSPGHPDLRAFIGRNNHNHPMAVFWADIENSSLTYKPCTRSEETLTLGNYSYFAEYGGKHSPEFYIGARLKREGHWISGRLGKLKLMANNHYPDLELFGSGKRITWHLCEPLLESFHPDVAGALSMPVVFSEPLPLRVNQIHPDAQDPTSVRKPSQVQRNTNASRAAQVKISFDEIRLEPRRAIRISILRPEDLVALDFEFHNFVFSNKGQGAFLQLADPKEKGTIIVFFPTQHTLEEAWFETSKIPASGKSESITLPARQLRAQRSRLVYELEAGSTGIPLILEELLDWSRFNLRVHPRAWVRLPALFKPLPFDTPVVTPRNSRPVVHVIEKVRGPLDYQVRQLQQPGIRRSDGFFLKEENIPVLFNTDKTATLSPAFSIAGIARMVLKPAPVPSDCTSLEVPALMYISPNQVNDFSHRVELKLKEFHSEERKEGALSVQARVFEAQTDRQQGDIAELWHTRLGVKLKDGKVVTGGLDEFRTIRVLWAFEAQEDYTYQAPLYKPFMTSLDASDRQILVHQTSNHSEKFTPVPVPVRHLMLTTLGAYLNTHVYFKLPDAYTTYLNIIEWQHLANLGRDHYVKVVREGYLFPFGHKAALVKVTERKFHNETRAALNRQRMYVVILEKEVTYNRTDPDKAFIEFPFQNVQIENDYSPDIDHPKDSTLVNFSSKKNIIKLKTGKDNEPAENTTYNFYICVGGQPFPFDMKAIDKEGVVHKFRLPLVFVENAAGRLPDQVKQVIDAYNTQAATKGRSSFNGQKVAFAESLLEGDTAFETSQITFNGQYYPAKGAADLKFHPQMREALVYIKQVEELTGSHELVKISLVDDDNAGHVFASVDGAKVDFSGGSDKAGGFLTPNMEITALSRLQGPLGGKLDDCKNLVFNAAEFFKSASLPSAKIFGCIDLFALLKVTDLGGKFDAFITAVNQARSEMERIRAELQVLENQAHETKADLTAAIKAKQDELKSKISSLLDILKNSVPRIPNFKTFLTDDAFHAEYRWQPEMLDKNITVIPQLLAVNVTNPLTALSVTTSLEKPFDASLPARVNGNARFEGFEVVVASMIGVSFKYLEFRTGSSQKTDVKVELEKVPLSFMGPLSFVNSLQSIIPSSGFGGDGPYIDLTPTGVTAGFSIGIPTVAVGICAIANITLGASITLPFTGDPLLLAFNFCTRDNPFLLTISCFGGGGFFKLTTSLEHIVAVEAAFEFGAAMALNVGVASGSVSAMGGIYFKSEIAEINGQEAHIVVLTGYLRLNGQLCIISLITVSLEFYLAFTANFISKGGKEVVDKLVGEATLKVKVEVLFFSKTVSVSVRREMQGADADPKFAEMIFPEDWEEYCLAFAS